MGRRRQEYIIPEDFEVEQVGDDDQLEDDYTLFKTLITENKDE
jgi:hypothetical protein